MFWGKIVVQETCGALKLWNLSNEREQISCVTRCGCPSLDSDLDYKVKEPVCL